MYHFKCESIVMSVKHLTHQLTAEQFSSAGNPLVLKYCRNGRMKVSINTQVAVVGPPASINKVLFSECL